MFRFLKPGRLILYILLGVVFINAFSSPSFELPSQVIVSQGDTYQVFLQDLGRLDRIRTQRALGSDDTLQPLQVGTYQFSGSYTPQSLVTALNTGPSYEYIQVTLLEGWSSYDIDQYLANQGLIETGVYRSFITDRAVIERNASVYGFLEQALEDRPDLNTLEGYLYPDTYRLDANKPIVSQLVRSQLQAFDNRVWQPYGDRLTQFSSILISQGRKFSLSSYGSVILASIILKEEQRPVNMPAVSGVFMNRLDQGMRLDADITLCYGLQTGYETCTPQQIVNNLYDRSNVYNTRQLGGLTPTPIANITDASILAVLESESHTNLFYLHDPSGGLHMATTNVQHNLNKSKYLR